jgi:hypothetical protein
MSERDEKRMGEEAMKESYLHSKIFYDVDDIVD